MNGIVAQIAPTKPDPAAADRRRWYVVCCKPRQELVAQENLRRQGFEVYLPRIKVRQRRRDRWVESVQVLFPRYLFVHVDRGAQSTASIRSTRGAVGLVRFGGEPAMAPNRVIDAIIDREDAGLDDELQPAFQSGDPVRMLEGPFAGMDGIFASADGEKRAVLLIELLGKTNRVRVDRDWIIRAA
jgi:transcriptional antiterminator RfaH